MKDVKLSLKANTVWNLSGSLIQAFSNWIILIIIAKLSTAEMVGVFTLGLAITAPLLLLMRFHLRNAITSDVGYKYSFNEYYTLRTYSSILFVISMIIIMFFYSIDTYSQITIIVLSIGKYFESMSDIMQGYWQREERLDIVAKSRVINALA